MSGVACISRWPTTTRWPWLACALGRQVRLQHRRRRLLGLEDERVVLVAALEDDHEAARADAADADDLEREVGEAVALEELAPALGHRGAVVLEDLLRSAAGAARRSRRAVTTGGSSRMTRRPSTIAVSDSKARMPSRRRALVKMASSLARRAAGSALERARSPRRPPGCRVVGDAGVPDVDEAHAGVAGHPLAVAADGRHRRCAVLGGAEAVGAAGDDDARGEPLDVPLPGPRQRLVEVVGVEHERPLGRGEQPEVGQVGVAAGLDDDVGPRRGGEVEGHHRGRAAVVGEGRLGHARVAQRHEVLAAGPPPALRGSRSGRGPAAGSKAAWLVRGTRLRAALPASARSAGWTHGRAVHAGPWAGRSACQAASYCAAVAASGACLRGRRGAAVSSVMAGSLFG